MLHRTEHVAWLLAAAQERLFNAEAGLEHGRFAEVGGDDVKGGLQVGELAQDLGMR
jgi:hypothetical protein